MNELQSKFAVSERRACLVIDQPRQSQRYQPKVSSDEPALLKDILNLVREFPRYGYRLICGKLRQLGWTINPKRVYRIWKKEGLKVPIKKQKKRRMGDSTNASHRQRAEHPNHVWSWDFIFDRTASGKALKWLNIVDEFTRENVDRLWCISFESMMLGNKMPLHPVKIEHLLVDAFYDCLKMGFDHAMEFS